MHLPLPPPKLPLSAAFRAVMYSPGIWLTRENQKANPKHVWSTRNRWREAWWEGRGQVQKGLGVLFQDPCGYRRGMSWILKAYRAHLGENICKGRTCSAFMSTSCVPGTMPNAFSIPYLLPLSTGIQFNPLWILRRKTLWVKSHSAIAFNFTTWSAQQIWQGWLCLIEKEHHKQEIIVKVIYLFLFHPAIKSPRRCHERSLTNCNTNPWRTWLLYFGRCNFTTISSWN